MNKPKYYVVVGDGGPFSTFEFETRKEVNEWLNSSGVRPVENTLVINNGDQDMEILIFNRETIKTTVSMV